MRPLSRNVALIVVAVAVMAAAVWAAGRLQRDTVTASFRQTEAVQRILTAMLDQETGLRGFLQTGREDFLAPYEHGERAFGRAVADARRHTPGDDRQVHLLLDRAERTAQGWETSADAAITEVRRTGVRDVAVGEAVRRKATMDAVRRTVSTLTARLERSRSKALGRTGTLSVALIVGLSMLFAAAGWLALGRPAAIRDRRERAEAARRERQSAFAHALQFMDSEAETHGLVRRHLQESIPGSQVVVMQRTPGADRLEAATGLDDGHAMAVALSVAEPRACLAVRLGHSETRTASDLLQCPLCGTLGRELTTCTPLLVSGEVIGSVLVAHDEELGEGGRQDVDETVTQAAPVIANMRNLALAEQRAATDALTGLANRRAIQERLRQMFAHAARSEQSLAVVAIDLDHFKQINDRLGHDKGDDVLVAVAHALTHGLRASDFVGRQGGEEFVALLPDTGLDGALAAAENLRCGIAGLHIPGLDRRVTASLGVAVFPEDAAEGDDLLRQADRALYAAKAAGRDRVSASAGAAFPQPAG